MVSNLFLLFVFAVSADEIGLKNLGDRFLGPVETIVGGQEATEGQFPWQLRLLKNGTFACGAVLISRKRALTSANCLTNETYSAVGGEDDTQVTSGREVSRVVKSWTKHPEADIGIIRFKKVFPLRNYIRPIVMADNTSPDFAGVTCTISGWGRTKAPVPPDCVKGGGEFPTTIHYADIPVISNCECTSRWSRFNVTMHPGQVCVYKPSKSACGGDSGSPLVCDGVLAGLASWGLRSCNGSYPTVYTRISYFQDWIKENKKEKASNI